MRTPEVFLATIAAPVTMPPPAPGPLLAGWDWVVLAGYAALLALSGWLLARRAPKDAKAYFLAERSMPAWAVAVSLLATMQSAATFIGVPEYSYTRDLTYLLGNLAPLLAAVIAALVFLPRYYREGVGSPYEFLERRLGPAARTATSWTYLLGRMLAAGARTYIGALALSLALFADTQTWQLCACIGAIMLVGVLYTLVGGVRSVIWTDVLQVGVYLGAAVVALVALRMAIPASNAEILSELRTFTAPGAEEPRDKLRLFSLGLPGTDGFSPRETFTLFTALTGLMLLNLAALAMDQDMVQRTLTCRSHLHAARSVLLSSLVGVPVALLFLSIGLLLTVFYNSPSLMSAALPANTPASKDIFQTFFLTQMPEGLRGLMIAAVLAVGPIGINATLNSMGSTLMRDGYERLVPTRDARRDLRVGRLLVVMCGVALFGASCLCAVWHGSSGQGLIDFALGVVTFAYAGLLGVFLCAVCTRRGSSASAIAALLAGFLAMLAQQAWAMEALGLGHVALAMPHQLLIASGAAFLVCCMGTRRAVTPQADAA